MLLFMISKVSKLSAKTGIPVSSVRALNGTAYNFSWCCLLLLCYRPSFGDWRSEMWPCKVAFSNSLQTACGTAGKTEPEHPSLMPGLSARSPALKHRLGKARSQSPAMCIAGFHSAHLLGQPLCKTDASLFPAWYQHSRLGGWSFLSVVAAQGLDFGYCKASSSASLAEQGGEPKYSFISSNRKILWLCHQQLFSWST